MADVLTVDGSDLGDEIGLLYLRIFGEQYYGGAKYGDYLAGDASFSKTATTKF